MCITNKDRFTYDTVIVGFFIFIKFNKLGCKGADTHDNITDQRACDESISSVKGLWVTLPILYG